MTWPRSKRSMTEKSLPTSHPSRLNTAFRESFEQDLSPINDSALLRRIRKLIEPVEAARIFQQIPSLKSLESTRKYYRIHVDD